ncbi:MAG: hypothetical protein MUC48_08135 [Leptolyngbya sp. Prado105]|jgi:hypothetical protein|nr:hypothetical protein [Leptolyngbya sp. Prado105]
MKSVIGLTTLALVSLSSFAPGIAASASPTRSSRSNEPVLIAESPATLANRIELQRRWAQQRRNAEQIRLNRDQRIRDRQLDFQRRQQEAKARAEARQQAAAIRREQERRYFESLTPEQKKAYLAQKEAQRRAQLQFLETVFGAMLGGGGFSAGSPSGRDFAQDELIRQQDEARFGQPSAPESAPPASSSGFYGNCHGGAAYGC